MWQKQLENLMPHDIGGLRLRCTGAEDTDVHLILYNDPQVRRFVGEPVGLSRDEALRAVQERPAGMAGIFAVEDLSNGCTIGECGFIGNNYIPEADMSIMLLPAYQRSGYGKRILLGLYRLWTGALGNEVCVATTPANNSPAASIFHACEFVCTGEYADIAGVAHRVFQRKRGAAT